MATDGSVTGRLEGIDISKYQRTTPSLAGRSFVIVKASNGDDKDPRYDYHVANVRRAGLVVGAYHFGVGAAQASVESQVDAFLAAAKSADVLALDLERNVRIRRVVNGKAVWVQLPSMTREEGREFIRLLRPRASGRKILLYSSRGTWPGDLGQDANWVADYAGNPNRPGVSPRIKWAIWQWTSTPYDRNRFNGDRVALRALFGSPGTPPNTSTEAEEVIVVTIELLPAPRVFATKGSSLRRFTATGEVLPPIPAPYAATVDANVAIQSKGVPRGSGFLRLASGGSAGNFVMASQVELG